MYKLAQGLDKSAVQHAVKKSVQRTMFAVAISALLTIAIMHFFLGMIHPLGLLCSILLPILLSAPSTLVLNLKNQQLRAANKRLDALASTDSLTGAMTRRAFCADVAKHLPDETQETNAATPSKEYALLLLDVDKFKAVNDTFGHEAGDNALQLLVGAIQHRYGETYPLARFGGEEFTMFLPNANLHRAQAVAEEVCKKIYSTDYRAAGIDAPITVSIGVATAIDGTTLQQLYRAADKMLYAAKNNGRNCVKSEIEQPAEDQAQTAAQTAA